MRDDFGSAEQDAMWAKIKAKLDAMGRNLVTTPCAYYGCLPDEWLTYEKADRLPGLTVFQVERGEAQTCLSCGETRYRNVEWTLEDHADAEPWKS